MSKTCQLATISVAIRLREIELQKRYQNLPKRRLIILKRNFTKLVKTLRERFEISDTVLTEFAPFA